jgi:hypothetical protein
VAAVYAGAADDEFARMIQPINHRVIPAKRGESRARAGTHSEICVSRRSGSRIALLRWQLRRACGMTGDLNE